MNWKRIISTIIAVLFLLGIRVTENYDFGIFVGVLIIAEKLKWKQ